VPVLRKALFLWAVALLLVALLVPDAGSALASLILPVIGPLVDLPIDAALDWSVAIALAPWLLRPCPRTLCVSTRPQSLARTGGRRRNVPQ
jgi:hypothetical protein